ncbi:MAG: hypothetical protein SFT93_01400 [Rickettsiaceae bacterium]|nr:hypothetical protein [Rickettsiaceae bacterium]
MSKDSQANKVTQKILFFVNLFTTFWSGSSSKDPLIAAKKLLGHREYSGVFSAIYHNDASYHRDQVNKFRKLPAEMQEKIVDELAKYHKAFRQEGNTTIAVGKYQEPINFHLADLYNENLPMDSIVKLANTVLAEDFASLKIMLISNIKAKKRKIDKFDDLLTLSKLSEDKAAYFDILRTDPPEDTPQNLYKALEEDDLRSQYYQNLFRNNDARGIISFAKDALTAGIKNGGKNAREILGTFYAHLTSTTEEDFNAFTQIKLSDLSYMLDYHLKMKPIVEKAVLDLIDIFMLANEKGKIEFLRAKDGITFARLVCSAGFGALPFDDILGLIEPQALKNQTDNDQAIKFDDVDYLLKYYHDNKSIDQSTKDAAINKLIDILIHASKIKGAPPNIMDYLLESKDRKELATLYATKKSSSNIFEPFSANSSSLDQVEQIDLEKTASFASKALLSGNFRIAKDILKSSNQGKIQFDLSEQNASAQTQSNQDISHRRSSSRNNGYTTNETDSVISDSDRNAQIINLDDLRESDLIPDNRTRSRSSSSSRSFSDHSGLSNSETESEGSLDWDSMYDLQFSSKYLAQDPILTLGLQAAAIDKFIYIRDTSESDKQELDEDSQNDLKDIIRYTRNYGYDKELGAFYANCTDNLLQKISSESNSSVSSMLRFVIGIEEPLPNFSDGEKEVIKIISQVPQIYEKYPKLREYQIKIKKEEAENYIDPEEQVNEMRSSFRTDSTSSVSTNSSVPKVRTKDQNTLGK